MNHEERRCLRQETAIASIAKYYAVPKHVADLERSLRESARNPSYCDFDDELIQIRATNPKWFKAI